MASNQTPEVKQNEPGLRKQLSPMHVWAIAFGCVIGWGSFINPGKKFLPNSGVAGTAIAMFFGALVMMIIAFSYAYMVPKYPKAGGEFTFTKMCFGKTSAFVCGWFLVAAYLTNVPMNSTAIGLIVDGLDGAADILKFGFHYQIAGFDVWMGEMIFAMAILIIFGTLNIIGVKKAGIVQTILACLLAVSVLTLTVAALCSDKTSIANMAPWWGFNKSEAIAAYTNGTFSSIDEFSHSGSLGIASAILATFAIAPWAYVGFDTIPQAAEEFKFSYKKVSLIMFVAIFFGCFVYTANNTIAAAALTNWPELIIESSSTPWLLLAAAERLLGTPGKVLVGVAVSCAVLSGIMGFYLATSRLMYSMSRDGYLPAWFGKVDAKYGTPKNAMIFCIAISLSGPILGREALGWFVDMAAIGASIGYFYTSAATLVTLKRFGDARPFLKAMAVLGVIFSVAFMILQLIPIPGLSGVHFGKESYIMLLVWIALGAVFYARQRDYFRKEKEQ
ncbi:MAG: APC family permease [Lachnospiraceae bacterium]|nr:APC family permease [Lachnospiraceae bacterium]